MYHRFSSPSPPPTFTHPSATPDLRVETTLHFQWQPRQRQADSAWQTGRLAGDVHVTVLHYRPEQTPRFQPRACQPPSWLNSVPSSPTSFPPTPSLVLHLRSTVAQPSSILASSRFYVRVTGRVGRLWDDLPTLPGWADREEKIRKKRKKHRHRQRHRRPKEKRRRSRERRTVRASGGRRYVSRGRVQTRRRISRYLEDKGCFRRSSKIAKGTLKRCYFPPSLFPFPFPFLLLSFSLSFTLAISAATSFALCTSSSPTRIDSYIRDVFSEVDRRSA